MKKQTQSTKPVVNSVVEVEFDAKHSDSPLCACERCNAEWLARRGQPLSQKHTKHHVPPIDLANKKEFTARCKKLGIEIALKNEHNMRIASWRLVDPSTSYAFVCGFDTDVVSILTRMEAENQALQGAALALFTPRPQPVVVSTTKGATLTGGPWCVMCGEPGGLPSPNMVGAAGLLKLRLHFPEGDARLKAARLHPGRCRKRLRQLLDTAKGKATT